MTSETTLLDAAHGQMQADEADDAARLRFYERLADAELFVLLTEEARGADLSPELFDLGDARFVLVFDREERLAGFVGRPAPYAALTGRVVASMLAGRDIGLAVNLETASAILIPPPAVAWLHATLGHAPREVEARIEGFAPPVGLPEVLLRALDTKLASAAGLAQSAWLVGVSYDGGTKGHLLGFIDARPGSEPALAQAAGEALTFSGIEAGAMDVGFFAASDPAAAHMARHGLRFDLPQPEVPARAEPAAPGSDPDRPPILR
ncbi:MAG: SseB family protein [Rhodobacteraceae bacterium]|nr:SseB family protein [Paracoccaceae bacterium]